MSRARRLLLGPAVLLTAACMPSVDAPEASGMAGRWLVENGSVQCGNNPLLSFSADRSWMLFWLEHFRPDAGMPLPVVSPALLEAGTGRLVLPAGPADRVTAPSFDPTSACWDDVDNALFVRSTSLPGEAERRWYRSEINIAAELAPAPAPPPHCRRPPEREWQWHRQASIAAAARGDLEIVRDGCCAVELRRRDGLLLARHEATRSLSDQVLISRYAWSDNGTRLAYTLSEETSWRFARPSASFMLETPGQPQLLEGQLYAFSWRGDDELISCARRPHAQGGGNSLKIWRFEAVTP